MHQTMKGHCTSFFLLPTRFYSTTKPSPPNQQQALGEDPHPCGLVSFFFALHDDEQMLGVDAHTILVASASPIKLKPDGVVNGIQNITNKLFKRGLLR
jgi:hypothetical protein